MHGPARQGLFDEIGPVLGRLRGLRGISQQALADRVGINRATLSRWETGAYQPTASAIQRILDVLEVDERELLKTLGQLRRERDGRPVEVEVLLDMTDRSALLTAEFFQAEKAGYGEEWLKGMRDLLDHLTRTHQHLRQSGQGVGGPEGGHQQIVCLHAVNRILGRRLRRP